MAVRSHTEVRYRMDTERSVLKAAFGPLVKENEPLAKYTSARLGGAAEFFAIAEEADELAEMVRAAWRIKIRPFILGGGSNVIVSDAGVRGLVILNRARAVEVHEGDEPPWVRVESGMNLGLLARQCAARGLTCDAHLHHRIHGHDAQRREDALCDGGAGEAGEVQR